MIIACSVCNKPFREDEEVRYTADSFWHELGSRIHFSVSKPHNVIRDSLRHSACEEKEWV
jgi:hypothetical protein